MLNGPTSERLIDPWTSHLSHSLNVSLHLNSTLTALTTTSTTTVQPSLRTNTTLNSTHPTVTNTTTVTGATLSDGKVIQADAYVLALPIRLVKSLTGDDIVGAAFGTGNEWSVG